MSQLQQIVRGGMNTYARNENGYFPLDLPDPLIAKQPAGIQLIAASPYLFYVCRTVRTICATEPITIFCRTILLCWM